MIIIDTSIWIDFFRGNNPELSNTLAELIENRIAVGLSAVFGELLQGVKSTDEARVIMEFWENIPKVNEADLFIAAGKLSLKYKMFSKGVGLIDCYILAASKENNFNLWTADKKLFEAFQVIAA